MSLTESDMKDRTPNEGLRMFDDKECRGCCVNYSNGVVICTTKSNITYRETTINCPCQICLIKMMCEKGCSTYTQYTRLSDIQGEIKNVKDPKELEELKAEYIIGARSYHELSKTK